MPQKIGPIISDGAEKWLRESFETLNAGAVYCLDSMPGLYSRTLHDLRGKFSRGELMLLLDVMNATILMSGLAGQHIRANVADGIDLDGLTDKWGIEGAALNAKLAALPIFAIACLEIWTQAFWQQKDHSNIEEWAGRLAG